MYFKIIASTQPFDVNMFALPALKSPTRTEDMSKFVRGFDLGKSTVEECKWTTQLIEIRVENPMYEQGEVE